MKTLTYTLFIVLLITSCEPKQATKTSPNSVQQEMPQAELMIPVEETNLLISALASNDMQGRAAGSAGYDLAVNYVEEFLFENQFSPFDDDFLHEFSTDKISSKNVVAFANDYNANEPTILLSAHLDHLPPTSSANDKIMNGANDNASGVTAVLQLAKQLKQANHNENIMVALLSAEEMGLIGAQELANYLKENNISVDYNINFEMIGTTLTNSPGAVYITGPDKSNLRDMLNTGYGHELVQSLSMAEKYQLFMRSDNYAFYQTLNIPAHSLSTFDFTNFDYYHKAGDEVDKLDIDNMNRVINNLYVAIDYLLKNNTTIELNE